MNEQLMFSKEEICRMFNCSMEQLNRQYAANAAQLEKDAAHAEKIGKKYRGWTAEQWKAAADKYKALAK